MPNSILLRQDAQRRIETEISVGPKLILYIALHVNNAREFSDSSSSYQNVYHIYNEVLIYDIQYVLYIVFYRSGNFNMYR